MKKLLMLMSLGAIVPMFAARPILKYGDVNPITGKVVGPYKGSPTGQGYNKGITGGYTGYNNNNMPENRTSFIDENGKPLPPALPPRPTTKPFKQFTAQDLKNVQLRPVHVAGQAETAIAQQQTGEMRTAVPFTGADLNAQKGLLKKPTDVRPALGQNNNQELANQIAKRRGSIEPEEELMIQEEWE